MPDATICEVCDEPIDIRTGLLHTATGYRHLACGQTESEVNRAYRALALWMRWFEEDGDTWLPHYGSGAHDCFFCTEDHPNHEEDCIYLAAKELVAGEAEAVSDGR